MQTARTVWPWRCVGWCAHRGWIKCKTKKKKMFMSSAHFIIAIDPRTLQDLNCFMHRSAATAVIAEANGRRKNMPFLWTTRRWLSKRASRCCFGCAGTMCRICKTSREWNGSRVLLQIKLVLRVHDSFHKAICHLSLSLPRPQGYT